MYGMTIKQIEAVTKIAAAVKRSSFVCGQACEVLGGEAAATVKLIDELCALGVLQCPQTHGLADHHYRISREVLNRISA